MPEVLLQRPDGLQVLRSTRVAVRDARVAGHDRRDQINNADSVSQARRLWYLETHDAMPGSASETVADPQIAGVAVCPEAKDARTLPDSQRRDLPVHLRRQEHALVGLDVS